MPTLVGERKISVVLRPLSDLLTILVVVVVVIVIILVLTNFITLSLILRQERGLRMIENRILRRIFRPNRDANREWKRFHNEELHGLYRSPKIVKVIKSRRLRWAGHIIRMEEGRSAFKILTGTPTGKKSLGRPRR